MATYNTALGRYRIESSSGCISRIEAVLHDDDNTHTSVPDALTDRAFAELEEYFCGHRTTFDLPLLLLGSDFQTAVWHALQKIPYGQTRRYADIATDIGRHGAARAVGQAIHQNPIAIVIPCHRVIGSDGSLHGYAAGLQRKRLLLTLEKQAPTTQQSRQW